MGNGTFKDQLKFFGYDAEEAYFHEENLRKVFDIRERIRKQREAAESSAASRSPSADDKQLTLDLGSRPQKAVVVPFKRAS